MKSGAYKFLVKKLSSSYPIQYPLNTNCIFWVYDEKILRTKKLCKILGDETNIVNNKYQIIFELDLIENTLYADFESIMRVLLDEYDGKISDITYLIRRIFEKHMKKLENQSITKIDHIDIDNLSIRSADFSYE